METSIPLNATSTGASSRKHRIRARGGLGLRVSTAEKPSKLDLAPAALGDEPQERRRSADALDMKMISYACVFAIAALAFAGCGGGDGQDMGKFNADLAEYMTEEAAEGGFVVKITATCTPAEDDRANCDIIIRNIAGDEEEATAENVRRDGSKFVWDHES